MNALFVNIILYLTHYLIFLGATLSISLIYVKMMKKDYNKVHMW